MGYFYLMESDKNQINKTNSETLEIVNTAKLNKKKYKSKPVNNNIDKDSNNTSKTSKLLKNKENLAKEEDEQMKIDSDDGSYEDYYSEDDCDDDENMVGDINDDDFLDKSEDFEEMEDEEEPEKEKKINVNIWDEDKKMQDDEKLDFDNEAYEMLHRSKVEWPCMSLDFVLAENFQNFYEKDQSSRLNMSKDNYPYTSYVVAGSQTSMQNGFLYGMKWFNMHKTKYDDDPEKGADSDEEEGEDPFMKYDKVQINGNVNKLHTMKNSYLCGIWSDSPSVEIVDMRKLFEDLEQLDEIGT